MELNILDHRLKVSTIDAANIKFFIPAILEIAFIQRSKCRFFSFTKTCDDYTIVLDESAQEVMPVHSSIRTVKEIWRPLVVSAGPDADTRQVSGISKIAKSIIIPLADNNVSVYCISTYQTDYVLVKEQQLQETCHVLAAYFHITMERSTSSSPVDVPPDLVRPPLDKWRDSPRPITRPFSALAGTFCVASMDPDVLGSLCVPLLDLMFYSADATATSSSAADDSPGDGLSVLYNGHHRCKDEAFFMFIVVDDDISLVLDSCALQKFPPGSLFNTKEQWKMIKIGGFPVGLGFDECGIVAMMIDPLVDIGESDYYLSTYYSDHTLVPVENFDLVQKLLRERAALSASTERA